MDKSRLKVLFVMDPLESIIYDHDSSFALMLGLQEEGFEVYHCLPRDLVARPGGAGAMATRIEVFFDPERPVVAGERSFRQASEFSLASMRKNPPVDDAYVYATYVLDLFARAGALVVNSPESLRNLNEKMVILQFPRHMPETIVSSDGVLIREFLAECGGRGVAKPIDGYAGLGIVILDLSDGNLGSLLEMLTVSGERMTMVQTYLPGAKIGDKRVWMAGGEILGQIIRVPGDSDFRGNMRAGAVAKACDLTAREREVSLDVGRTLLKQGVVMLGLDLIDERLTEVNLTSPTGIQEIDRLTGATSGRDTARCLVSLVRGDVSLARGS